MNQVLKIVLVSLFGATGPIAAWLISYGVPKEQVGPFLEALQPVLATITPVLSASFLGWLNKISERIKSIKAMEPEAANAAVAALPVEAKTAIKIAATPDKAILAAAGAMPGVEVKVDATASPGAMAAATDPTVPGVNPA